MLRKNLQILIAAGILTTGIAVCAQAEEKGTTSQDREQVRTAEQSQVKEQMQAGAPSEKADGDMTMTQERARTKEQKKDGTGDKAQDRLRDRDRDRIHDPLGSGGGNGMSRGKGR